MSDPSIEAPPFGWVTNEPTAAVAVAGIAVQSCLVRVAALRTDLGVEAAAREAAAVVCSGLGARGCRIEVVPGPGRVTAVAGQDPHAPTPSDDPMVLTTATLVRNEEPWGEITLVDMSPLLVRSLDAVSSVVAATLANAAQAERLRLETATIDLVSYAVDLHGELTDEHAGRLRTLLQAIPGVRRAVVSLGGPLPTVEWSNALLVQVGSTLTGMQIATTFEPGQHSRLTAEEVVRSALGTLGATREREERLNRLTREVDWDIVSGTGNRRCAMRSLHSAVARADRSAEAVSVLVCDLDHFARVNAVEGRNAGDELLHGFAALLEANTRLYDSIARLDDNTLVVVLPNTTKTTAVGVAERLRRNTSDQLLSTGGQIRQTVSIGVSAFPFDGDDPDTVLATASRALRRAKTNGRDRVEA